MLCMLDKGPQGPTYCTVPDKQARETLFTCEKEVLVAVTVDIALLGCDSV
jgi:hypothetical protein